MRPQALIAVALLGVAALAAVGFARMRAYIHRDPDFCASCHRTSPEFAVWNRGAHARIACQSCHHASVDESVSMLRSFLAGTPAGHADGQHAQVEIGACAACHLTHDRQWKDIGASRGHRIHAIDQKISCVRCHATGVHAFEPVVASCKTCHGEHAVRAEGMQQVHCFACHDFLSSERDLRPTRRDCLRCHQAEGLHPSRFPDSAPMQFACASCHKPHAAKDKELIACTQCHGAIAAAGLHEVKAHGDCRACHRAHSWRSEPADCLRCHKNAATHDPGLNCSSCHSWKGSSAPPPAPRGR